MSDMAALCRYNGNMMIIDGQLATLNIGRVIEYNADDRIRAGTSFSRISVDRAHRTILERST